MRILAAMSGGVDSAVAAARAVDAGHDVVGVHLALSRAGGTLRTGSRGCCTIEDAMGARRAADRLGIPFYVWDFSERFRDDEAPARGLGPDLALEGVAEREQRVRQLARVEHPEDVGLVLVGVDRAPPPRPARPPSRACLRAGRECAPAARP